ncbi:protein transport protein Sec31A isoform X2 [Epargyreus clarus]|uniref:protein transport protein Sec31A isoform X2 n=1 Tax=Epargyreus clarus TaxID=520877 RepID=UPI003C308A91
MKVKELKRTVNVCWSPAETHPPMLAAGSAAQQVDASFSSSSHLELYALNLEDPGLDLELKSSLQTQQKFQKLVWSGAGVIVGGCDGGLLQFYNAEKLLNNASDALIGSSTKHSGHVSSLDINPYQKNLLASGASESEIFIWDLNNTAQPMAPGKRSQPHDHVQGLAWNHQVQHILGSTFTNRCVVWDLRKNEPIMKLSDSLSRTRWRSLAWHPSVATQLCIASEDDQVPVIQLWDLRLAASPLETLEGHQKGVLSLSWSRHDPELLLSAGKDGCVLCWNPNNAKLGCEVVVEAREPSSWVFDVSWAPRVPGLLAAAAFDQHVALHTLLGGSRPEGNAQSQSSIMESFGGADGFAALPAVARAPPPPAAATQPARAPRWLARPRAARFAFGGKLVTFDRCPQEQGSQKLVYINQVVSEPEIVELAAELDTVIGLTLSQEPDATEKLAEYCRAKGDAAAEQHERYTWFFLRANFMPTFRSEVLNLLGFKQDEIPSKFKGSAVAGDGHNEQVGLSRGESTETEAELSTDTSTDLSDAHTLIERKLANVDLEPSVTNVVIPSGEDTTSLICRALVCGNLEEAVELCLEAKRVADALIIASLGSQELLYKVQKYHLNSCAADPVSLVAGSLLRGQWDGMLQRAAPHCWKDTLAAIVTHCDGEAVAHYCEMLGDKLSQESDPGLRAAASLCYVVAAEGEALAARLLAQGGAAPAALAARAELALLTRRAAAARGRPAQPGGKLDTVLSEYAGRLAAQGCLRSALAALQAADCELAARLRRALRLHDRHDQYAQQQHQQQQQMQQQQQQYTARSRTVSGHSQKRGHLVGHNDISNTYSAVPPSYDPGWGGPAPSFPGAAPLQSQPPLPPQPMQPQPMQPQPMQPQPLQPPQPPRPGSVGPQSGGITGRSKYKVDPSVQSAPLYNQYSFNNPVTSQPGFGYNSPLPDAYAASSVPTPGFQPINNPVNPMNPMNPVNPVNPVPLNPVNGSYYGQPEPAVAAQPTKPVPPGWNDPPMMSKAKPKQEAPVQQAPITHPLFGVEPPQHVPLVPPQGQFPGQQYPGQGQQYPGQGQQFPGQGQQFPGQGQQFPGQGQQYPGQGMYPPGQDQYQGYQQQVPPGFTQQQQQQVESPAPAAEPAPKAPLPEQHAALQTVFDTLRTECYARTDNSAIKRRLEDVQRRLEILYDMLREYRLSESALGSLHACAGAARGGDYERALAAAAATATGADFAAVASFLPALKTLCLLCKQHEVYLR